MAQRGAAVCAASLICACSGGAGSGAPGTPSLPKPAQAYTGPLASTTFALAVPAKSGSSATRRPSFISSGTQSVTITLNTVNGGAPPAGLTLSATTNISIATCASGCTVSGPSVPPGTDNFTVTLFSGTGGAGNALSTDTQDVTITAGTSNTATLSLKGIPSSFTISGVPAGTAGTAFGAPATLTVVAKDASGAAITGSYQNSVTFTDSDTSSLTQGSALSVNSGSAASSVTIGASTDVVKLNYGGLAITPATLTAAATGATSSTATFTPALNPIVYSGPTVAGAPEIDLFATSGTGSTGTFTASETGWTNAPYNQMLTLTAPGGCGSFVGVSPASGTSFTATAIASPSVGSCTATLHDGVGQSATVSLTYTQFSFTIQSKHRTP